MARLRNPDDSSLNDKVFRRILDDVMYLVLEPGTMVSVQKLADMYDCSRTPAREAVVRLQQKNLVRIYPQSHTVIAPISPSRLEQECFIWKALETAAVEKFLRNCSEFVLDSMDYMAGIMERTAPTGNKHLFFDTLQRFHAYYFTVARKQLSADTINATNTDFNRLSYLTLSSENGMEIVAACHRKYVQAASQMDPIALRAAICEYQEHILHHEPLVRAEHPTFFSE